MTAIDLHYEDHGDGPPLLLLHGTTGTRDDFQHLFDLEALARSWRVIRPDLRGHGRSLNPDEALLQRQCAADVLALCDRLRLVRVRAVGVSLGGNVLLHVATQQPARIEAMVTTGSPSHFPAQARAILRGVTEETRTADEWRLLRTKHGSDEQIRALWRNIRAWAELTDDLALSPAQLGAITARTLLVTGDRDPLYPVELFVEEYRAIPRAQLWVVPGAGHAPSYEIKDEFARRALAFLRG